MAIIFALEQIASKKMWPSGKKISLTTLLHQVVLLAGCDFHQRPFANQHVTLLQVSQSESLWVFWKQCYCIFFSWTKVFVIIVAENEEAKQADGSGSGLNQSRTVSDSKSNVKNYKNKCFSMWLLAERVCGTELLNIKKSSLISG